MKLSVIICCYNERATIRDVIQRTQAVNLGAGWDREILVVDNFSTDGTREILQQIDDLEITVFFHERNMGKGASIRTGIANMSGDYMFIQDADTEYAPTDQALFCRKVTESGAVAVFGSRVLAGAIKSRYRRTLFGNRLVTWIANVFFGGHLTDVATASKMVRGDVIQSLNLTSTGFDLDFELPAKLMLAGHEIVEIPISYNPRTYEEGKKIGFRDAIAAVMVMLRVRLGLTAVLRPQERMLEAPESRV